MTLRLYAMIPKHELAYIQAVFDSYEGLGRIRTEKHEGNQSLVLFMVDATQKNLFDDFLRHVSAEIAQPIQMI